MSSTKGILKPNHIIEDGDLAGSIDSGVIEAGNVDHFCIEASWTGSSPSGNLNIQGSINGVIWTNITPNLAVSGASGSGAVATSGIAAGSLSFTPYPRIRVRYTRTSGTGTINVWIAGKEN